MMDGDESDKTFQNIIDAVDNDSGTAEGSPKSSPKPPHLLLPAHTISAASVSKNQDT